MIKISDAILTIVLLAAWCYGMARAQTDWKYVPGIGTLIGGVCIMEDYAIPKK